MDGTQKKQKKVILASNLFSVAVTVGYMFLLKLDRNTEFLQILVKKFISSVCGSRDTVIL